MFLLILFFFFKHSSSSDTVKLKTKVKKESLRFPRCFTSCLKIPFSKNSTVLNNYYIEIEDFLVLKKDLDCYFGIFLSVLDDIINTSCVTEGFYEIYKAIQLKNKSLEVVVFPDPNSILDDRNTSRLKLRLRILRCNLLAGKNIHDLYKCLNDNIMGQMISIFPEKKSIKVILKVLKKKKGFLTRFFFSYKRNFVVLHKNKKIKLESVEMSVVWILNYIYIYREHIFYKPFVAVEAY